MKRLPAAYVKARQAVFDRAGGNCEARFALRCRGMGGQAHHVLRRSQGGRDIPEDMIWVCSTCHDAIHANPVEAFEKGLLRHARPTHIGQDG